MYVYVDYWYIVPMPITRRGGVGEGEDTGSITIHYDTWPSWDQDTPLSRHQDRLWNSDISQADNPSNIWLPHLHWPLDPAGMPLITTDLGKQDLTLSRLEITQIMTEVHFGWSKCLVWHSQANTVGLLVITLYNTVSHCHIQCRCPTQPLILLISCFLTRLQND